MKAVSPMNISAKTKIRHRNELNQTLAQLPLAAKRVIFMALVAIDSKTPMEEGRIFRVRAEDLAAVSQITSSAAYRQLQEGAKILKSSSLVLTGDDIIALAGDLNLPYSAKYKPDDIDLSITDFCAYFKKEGFLELRFSRVIEPYISNLIGKNNKYTTQFFTSSMRLTGKHASPLYQLIRKNYSKSKGKCSFTISVNDLKDEIIAYTFSADGEVEYLYPNFPTFKRDVLNKAIVEIEKVTEVKNINISVYAKEGRKVSVLKFDFFIDEDNEISDDELDSEQDLLNLLSRKT